MPICLIQDEANTFRPFPCLACVYAIFGKSRLLYLVYIPSLVFINTPPKGAESRLRRLTAPDNRGALPRTPVSLATRREAGLKAFPAPLL
jgi:hypothetical protein